MTFAAGAYVEVVDCKPGRSKAEMVPGADHSPYRADPSRSLGHTHGSL